MSPWTESDSVQGLFISGPCPLVPLQADYCRNPEVNSSGFPPNTGREANGSYPIAHSDGFCYV